MAKLDFGADRPLIGITCGVLASQSTPRVNGSMRYAEAVAAAGGIPVFIPPMAAEAAPVLAARFDGLVISGGGDVDPRHYGEEPTKYVGDVDPERDGIELALAREGLAGRIPILGICRGAQVINVAAGGTLIQDLPTQARSDVRHYQNAPRFQATHRVTLWADSQLAEICGAHHLVVNSFHHQAVRTVGSGLKPSAWAPDGIIEGLEADGPGWVIAVQWHPEELWQEHLPSFALFQRLVAEAVRRRPGWFSRSGCSGSLRMR